MLDVYSADPNQAGVLRLGFSLPTPIPMPGLRQGFGRLIRSQRDRGLVVILDPRVRTKYYGKQVLESLPDCAVVEESVSGRGALKP